MTKGKWRHRLSNIDLEGKSADCTICGKVRIKLINRKRRPGGRCINIINEEKARYESKKLHLSVSYINKPNVCDICKEKGVICWDHCHKTGKFRGWLCRRCNLILGHAKDSPLRLRDLADYLDK